MAILCIQVLYICLLYSVAVSIYSDGYFNTVDVIHVHIAPLAFLHAPPKSEFHLDKVLGGGGWGAGHNVPSPWK